MIVGEGISSAWQSYTTCDATIGLDTEAIEAVDTVHCKDLTAFAASTQTDVRRACKVNRCKFTVSRVGEATLSLQCLKQACPSNTFRNLTDAVTHAVKDAVLYEQAKTDQHLVEPSSTPEMLPDPMTVAEFARSLDASSPVRRHTYDRMLADAADAASQRLLPQYGVTAENVSSNYL